MKHLTSLLLIAAACVLTPTGAFAKDKDKHKHHKKDRDCHSQRDRDRHCDSRSSYGRFYGDRRSYYAPSYYAPRYEAPRYYSSYRGSSGGRCASQRSSGLSFFFGF